MAVRHFDGVTWQPFTLITNGAAIDNTVAVAMDARNTLHLAWTTYDEIYYRTRSSTGNWSSTVNLSNNPGSSRDPRMFVTPAGVPHVIWHDTSLGDSWEMAYATKVGDNWTAPLNLSNNPDPVIDAYGSIGVGPDGAVSVTWMDYSRVYYKRKHGANWPGYVILPSGPTVARGNETFVDANSNAHIIWEEDGDLMYMVNDVPDVTPPATVSNVVATPGNTTATIKWTNPHDFEFVGTRVLAKIGAYPVNETDGVEVCNVPAPAGTARNCEHVGLTNGTTYYYSVFAYDQSNNHAAAVHATALPAGPGDADRDDDVDQTDFGRFQACYSGATIHQNDPNCQWAFLDGDEDVDQNDFGIFQSCISGPGRPADPDCVN